jgi:beta-xylosidase
MRKTISAIIAAIALTGTVAASGFRNPVIRGFYPDPSICRVDSD